MKDAGMEVRENKIFLDLSKPKTFNLCLKGGEVRKG